MGLLANTLSKPQESLVISFGEDGSAESLHIDKFDLGFLGKKQITRATDIRFEDETQDWSIYLLDAKGENPTLSHKECKGLSSYEVARAVEVAWLNLCRVNDTDPRTGHGHVYLVQALRANGIAV